jgi:hypothetical protein
MKFFILLIREWPVSLSFATSTVFCMATTCRGVVHSRNAMMAVLLTPHRKAHGHAECPTRADEEATTATVYLSNSPVLAQTPCGTDGLHGRRADTNALATENDSSLLATRRLNTLQRGSIRQWRGSHFLDNSFSPKQGLKTFV